MSGASRYAADLTMIRVTAGAGPGEPTRVEVAAQPGLAREVLVDRALPLLRRARRALDQITDGSPRFRGGSHDGAALIESGQVRSLELLADAITALIGHDVTDQPPCDELAAVLADGTPTRIPLPCWETLTRDAQTSIPREAWPVELLEPAVPAPHGMTGEEYAHARYGRPMSGDPLTRTEAEDLAARAWTETPAEREARYEEINDALEAMGIAVIPPCPMAPYAEPSDWEQERAAAVPFMGPESSEPATPAEEPAPVLPPHNYLMPHRIGGIPAFASREEIAEWQDGVAGCPPGCPRRIAAEGRCPSCWEPLAGPPRLGCVGPSGHATPPVRQVLTPKSGEPAAPASPRQLLGPGDEAWRIGARR